MSSGGSSAPTSKLQPTQSNEPDPAQTSKVPVGQGPATLEEDDEFEDFPVEGERPFSSATRTENARADMSDTDWAQEDTEVPSGTTHLWEESWDDDDENEDFSKQLR